MTNLPSLYARVVAKRPDLAVKWLGRSTNTWADDHPPITVWIYGPSPATSRAMLDDHAAALILARWVEALPEEAWLGRPTTPVHGWRVCYRNKRAETTYDLVCFSPIEQSPIEALAAFYLGQET